MNNVISLQVCVLGNHTKYLLHNKYDTYFVLLMLSILYLLLVYHVVIKISTCCLEELSETI